jgi:hypothetical protein
MLLSRVPGEMFDTCENWGSLSGVTEDSCSLGCYTLSTGDIVSKDRCAVVFSVRAVQEDNGFTQNSEGIAVPGNVCKYLRLCTS